MKPRIWHRFITLTACLVALSGTAQANLIGGSELPFLRGEIAFGGFNVTGLISSAMPTGGATLSEATGIDFDSSNVTVLTGTEDYAGVGPGTSVTFNDIMVINRCQIRGFMMSSVPLSRRRREWFASY